MLREFTLKQGAAIGDEVGRDGLELRGFIRRRDDPVLVISDQA